MNPDNLYYDSYQVVTQEIPDELSLGISIMGCPVHCKGCHSPHLWDVNSAGKGTELTWLELRRIIEEQKQVSCILFLGGDWKPATLRMLFKRIWSIYGDTYKLALYTSRSPGECIREHLIDYLDYLKTGAYDMSRGDLTCPNTNQRLYRTRKGIIIEDITHKFWKHRHGDVC